MDLRTDQPEPSHIHVPRPSHAARGLVQLPSVCLANTRAQLADQCPEHTFGEPD
jgi:hypothetical protein